MEKTKVAINGFGRIGRAFFRLAQKSNGLDVVVINDIGSIENIVYLLKYDTVYVLHHSDIQAKNSFLIVDGKEIKFISERDPSKLPWKELDIDIVVESTGVFASYEKSKAHLDAGAKRVVITAPVKGKPPSGISGETVLMGVNEEKLSNCDISSNASCTTNAGSPVIKILHEKLGIEAALLNTIHGYTSSQNLVDGLHKKDIRRGRAAAANIVPSSTGAAVSTTKAIPELEGKFDGVASRVPVILGSLADITFVSSRDTSVDEINSILKNAAEEKKWEGIFTVTEEPIVSSDIIGNTYASVVDLSFTRVAHGNLVKVLSWYDNEVGYANTLVKHVIASAKYLK